MGDVADSMVEGEACEQCGTWFDDFLRTGCSPGHPRTCEECLREAKKKKQDQLQVGRRKRKKKKHRHER